MFQHLVQLNLRCVQYWGIHHFPGKVIPVADCFHCGKLYSCVQPESPQE